MWFRVKETQFERRFDSYPYGQCGTVSVTCLFAFLMGRAWRAFISRSEHAAHTPYWRFELGYEICAEVMKTMPAKGI